MASKKRVNQNGREVVTVQARGAVLPWGDKTTWTKAERLALVQRAQEGDPSTLPELRAMFAAHPDAAMRMFDPARTLHGELARQMSGDPDDLIWPELVMARAAAMQCELEADAPTPLERLLCQRIATCWLTCHFLEIRTPDPQWATSTDWRTLHDRMVTRAHDRLMNATLTLAKVRRLLRPEVQQVNIAAAGAQQLNVAAPQAPAVAITDVP